MDNDDRMVGRILSRREVLGLAAAAGATFLVACSTGKSTSTTAASETTQSAAQTTVATRATNTAAQAATSTATPVSSASTPTSLQLCVVSPELTEGPYFVDEKINRSDIRADPSDESVKDGVPLSLTFRVSQVGIDRCTPLTGATVDVWQCDALGVYSDVQDPGFNTAGKKFLRGYQVTDENGLVTFATIYPGWYQGRTVHIHFKIRSDSGSGSTYEFTSQLFFDDDLTDKVHALQPYASKGQRTLRNDGDQIFQQGGDQLTLALEQVDSGYQTTFDIGLHLS
jgi:protocatechuate 3,4-dioxygenase beta subunit